MSDPRSYALSFVEESLGLVQGSLTLSIVPPGVVDDITSVMRGDVPAQLGVPFIERELREALPAIESASIKEDGLFVRKARWPDAVPLAVCLTHDVDNVSRPREHVRKVRDRFTSSDYRKASLGLVSLYNNLSLIAKREKEHGFHSSFYLLSSNYPLATVRRTSLSLRKGGWDVGLHGDFGTHDSQEKMGEAVRRFEAGLGFRPRSLREHYLKFDYSKSWEVMEKAGFGYDSTVGTTDVLGFRVGLASPFHPPDGQWSPMGLLELPLVLMDTTLWGYLKRSEEEGFADVMRMMGMVEEVEGLFTLLWHQEAVRMRGGRIYWRLLDEFGRKGCFVGSGAEIAWWWRAREVPLVRMGKLVTLGGTPPSGLVLRVRTAPGKKLHVSSGSLAVSGDEYLVRPHDVHFTLEAE